MRHKKYLIMFSALFLSILMGLFIYVRNMAKTTNFNDKVMAVYLGDEEGNYRENSEIIFPTDGYVLNTEKSMCRNGGTIRQNPTTKKISLTASKTDSCTLYFDKVVSPTSEQTLVKLGITSKGTLSDFVDLAPKPTFKDNNFNGSQSSYNMTNYKSNYITYASSYTFDTSTGLYTLTNPQTCQYSSCYTTLRGKYIVERWGNSTNTVATSSNLEKIYKVGTGTTATSIPYINSSKTISNYDYSKDGVFEMEDNYGISYYFRGEVENNYVKFGKNKSGQEMYWRIVRINGDGTLRMIYDGTSTHANGESSEDRVALTNVAWNTNYNDAKYVGYMYGGLNGIASISKEQAQTNETDSNIKTLLDTWYKENIIDTGYSGAVSDTLFCNDRSFANNNIGTGFGTSTTYYSTYERNFSSSPTPSFKCPEKNDAFTKDDTINGNGALTYPIGLITADEIIAGGGEASAIQNNSKNNYKYYLYKGRSYWSFSPSYIYNNIMVFLMDGSGALHYFNNTSNLSPVINLTPEYVQTMVGTGTMTDPYRVEV